MSQSPASGFADRYENTLVPVIFIPWAQELIRRAAPTAGEHILDLGCGTGVVTRQVAALGINPGSLTGADHSAAMLDVARRNGPVGATWVEADAGNLPFDKGRFDLAFCQQALQFFPDRPRALSELHRVLRDGGRVVACVQRAIALNPLLSAQAAALEKNAGPDAANAVRAICGLPDAEVLHALFTGAGFQDVTVESVTLTLTHPDARAFAAGAMGGMHTGDKLSALDSAARDQAVADFLAALGPHAADGTLSVPHVSHVLTAHS